MNDIEPKEISLTSHLRISKPGEYFWSGKPLATIRATAKQVGRGVTVKSHDFLDGERVKVIRKVTINNETLTAYEIDKTAALRREVV